MKYKVIDISNHNIETMADHLVEEGFDTEAEARDCADRKNARRPEGSPRWAIVVPQDRRLWRGMEDLI